MMRLPGEIDFKGKQRGRQPYNPIDRIRLPVGRRLRHRFALQIRWQECFQTPMMRQGPTDRPSNFWESSDPSTAMTYGFSWPHSYHLNAAMMHGEPRMLRLWARNLSTVRRFTRKWMLQTAVLGFVLALAPAWGLAQDSLLRFEVKNYVITAELFPSQHLLSAKARVDIVPNSDITALAFELHSNFRVEKVVDTTGQDVSFRQDGQTLNLSLLNPLPGGKPASITVTYGGMLNSADGSPVEGIKVAYVGPEGSYLLYPGHWFPVSTYGVNRFTATMNITVPSDETVIASGKAATPERQPGKVTYTYVYDKPSFPGTVIAGHYVVQPATAVGADITLYLKPGHESLAASYGDTAAKILAFYSDVFGPLPSSHVDIVEIGDDTVGGYTAPGLVALASRAFTNPVNYRLLAHEISHLWWRCLVSAATPDDAFLDEGLAEYSKALYVQESAGDAAFEDLMRDTAIGALTHEEVAPIAQAGQLHEFTPEYQSIVFDKGAMVFHMLRWLIGDDAFRKTLRDDGGAVRLEIHHHRRVSTPGGEEPPSRN